MKILILGCSGLIGSAFISYLDKKSNYTIFGLSKTKIYSNKSVLKFTPFDFYKNKSKLIYFINIINPDIIINCCGITKHNSEYSNYLKVIYINSYLPKFLEKICISSSIRFIQISTDCIFSGNRGNYTENDIPDANDLYGITKYRGEVGNSLTIRTSVIGPELFTRNGLFEWFLSQKRECIGYKNAFFSGLTTIELATILLKLIIPNSNLKGIYHISSNKISKFNLLKLISIIFNHKIDLIQNKTFNIDRSLNSDKFIKETGYKKKKFSLQLKEMKLFNSDPYNSGKFI